MSGLYYRLAQTPDPEERLEDACMWKTLKDFYGAGITLLDTDEKMPAIGVFFGRSRIFEHNPLMLEAGNIAYWKDPGFLSGISRDFKVVDLEAADEIVKDLHARGKHAFVKSTALKHMTLKVPIGESLTGALGDMVWSFIDKPECLMVREYVEMRNERRFVVIDSQIVTQSSVQRDLTPLSRSFMPEAYGFAFEDLHFETPTAKTCHFDQNLTQEMTRFATRIVETSLKKNFILDLAQLEDGRIEAIEYNPLQIGQFGLYGCCPRQIAMASLNMLPPDMQISVMARKAANESIDFDPTLPKDNPDTARNEGFDL